MSGSQSLNEVPLYTGQTSLMAAAPERKHHRRSRTCSDLRWHRVRGLGGSTIVVHELAPVVGGVEFGDRAEAPSSLANRCRSVVALKSPWTGRNLQLRALRERERERERERDHLKNLASQRRRNGGVASSCARLGTRGGWGFEGRPRYSTTG
ncbi:MAG: hypothetical protein F4X48_02215 [Acidimicrobiia bacterium]|nr:hypothetical protein [Acidimicrobiia bacterium]